MNPNPAPQDYHLHTQFSCDCKATMMAMCRAALARGLPEIGFTEHYDLMPEDPCHGFFDVEAWWKELESCRETFQGMLTIRAGVELGEPHRFPSQIETLLADFPWDYSLGSLHWVGNGFIFQEPYFDRSADEAYRGYFTELARMAASGAFDILAHMDIVKRKGVGHYGPFDPADYESEIRSVLAVMAKRGLALEVNTGMLRKGLNQLSPPRVVFDWFREAGGEAVTLGSDAHRPEDLGADLDQAMEALESAGFTHLARFEARQASRLPMEVP